MGKATTAPVPSAPAPIPRNEGLKWQRVGAPVKDASGIIEDTFAVKVTGGTIMRVKRTAFNGLTKAPVMSDSMVFVPEPSAKD